MTKLELARQQYKEEKARRFFETHQKEIRYEYKKMNGLITPEKNRKRWERRTKPELHETVFNVSTSKLFSDYYNELEICAKHGYCPVSYSPEQFAERLQHVNQLEKFSWDYIEEKFSKDVFTNFGLEEDATLQSLPNLAPGRFNTIYYNFPFFDDMREDLIHLKKFKLCKEKINTKKFYRCSATFYLGRYHNQLVLFKESVMASLTLPSASYELTAIIQGKKKGNMLLFRYDYAPAASHQNKLCSKTSVAPQELENQPAHMHNLSKLFSVVYPSQTKNCDAITINEKRDFETVVKDLRKECNMANNYPILSKPDENIRHALEQFLDLSSTLN